jgi:hypothetical protein
LPIPETERKLREAAFFLPLMTAEERKAARPEPEAFGFYLSAFLSAGRSVTFVLQKEAGGELVYRPWHDAWAAHRGEHAELRPILGRASQSRAAARGPIAILATDPLVYDLACSYAALGRSTLTIEVFRDPDEAEQWLTAQAKAREQGGA